ncbi:MAG TPA: transcriptional regulator [Woeseiaceae bacterium]|nr:transcriptional regulator [Woeseiaceae bacterium]
MPDDSRKLITIVTEAILEVELCEQLEKLGATGYTVTNARGSGHRGIRDAGWSSSSNVRIEVVCNEEVAHRIVRHLRDNYYNDYAMILFESDVRVLRPEKF